MKKEIVAGAVLLLLIAGSVWNICSIDTLAGDIMRTLELSEAAADSGDFTAAKSEMDRGLKLWLDADGYTHIFLRHPEIDSTTDAFYELQELLIDGDSEGYSAAYAKLRYHLDSICGMEHISVGSVL
ncbi:MAG: DUF4363 family protein [Clostridiales bacterium]|nr:DUF4363 family protein [Clostridiales bacterium]